MNQASLDSSQFPKELKKKVKGLEVGGIFVDEFDDLFGSLKHLLQSVNGIVGDCGDSSHKAYFWIAMRHVSACCKM